MKEKKINIKNKQCETLILLSVLNGIITPTPQTIQYYKTAMFVEYPPKLKEAINDLKAHFN